VHIPYGEEFIDQEVEVEITEVGREKVLGRI